MPDQTSKKKEAFCFREWAESLFPSVEEVSIVEEIKMLNCIYSCRLSLVALVSLLQVISS